MYDATLVEALVAHLGPEHVAALLQLMRCPPSLTTLRVNTLRSTRDAALTQLRAELEARGESAAAASCTPHAALPDMITIDCTGPHELDIEQEAVVVVDRACGEALMRGADVFAPGVIGASSGLRAGQRVAVLADSRRRPLARGAKLPRRASEAMAESVALVHVGNGEARQGRVELFGAGGDAVGSGVAVRMDDRLYRTPAMRDVLPGTLLLQNLPSALAVHVLAPQPGERVLDLCCAPGGKTSHVVALMEGRGEVVAVDRAKERLRSAEALARRLKLPPIIEFRALDGTFAHESFAPRSFDRVLVDPPCSALGLRPKLLVEATAAELRACADYQRKLVASAAALVRPGGTLVYSTCTLNPGENEEIVAHILRAHPHLRLVPALPRLGSPGVDGCGLTPSERQLVQRFDPSEDGRHIGFFVAKFECVE